jgi:hypothetical protein
MASPEVNVRIRATDGASPVLTLIQGNLARTAASGALAARGMDRVTDAVKDIGRQAAGVDRDVGNLAVGLINLAGGGTLVTAAVGGLVFAYTQLTAASRAAHDENEKFVTSLVATAEKGAPAAEAIRGMDAAVKDLALHQRELSGLQNPGASAGWFTAIAPLVYRALGLTAKAQREIADAQTATGQAGKDYVTSTMQASAEAVKFGTASAFTRRQLEAYLDTLRATRDNEALATDARNAAAKELDSLTSAMGKTVEKGQNLAQSLAEQVSYYGQLAQLHPLTSQQLDELTGVLNAVTAAESDANTTRKDAIALLGAERQALALLGGEAAKQAEKDLRASVGRSPFTAPQRPADGRSLAPFAVPDGLIDTRSILSPSLVQGLEAGMDETIRSLDKTLAKAAREAQFTQIQQGFAQSISQSITDGITAGFDTALASGDIGAGFGALIGTLLSGIGAAMEQFGAAALVASQFMQSIMSSLMALDPSGAAAAAIGMIAMGAVFKALGNAASSAFGGGGGTGGGGVGGVRGRDEAETTRIIVQTPASAHATPATQMRPLHFTVIGTDSAKAQREIKELLRNADARAA